MRGPERTFLQEIIDWIFEDNGHDLGRIYPWDDRYSATELAALEAEPPPASEDVVRSYQIVVDVAFLNGAGPRIDGEQFSITLPEPPRRRRWIRQWQRWIRRRWWIRRRFRGTARNGAVRAQQSAGGRHRWGGHAGLGPAEGRRRCGDHGLPVPDRQEEPLDLHRQNHPYGHRTRQRHGLRLRRLRAVNRIGKSRASNRAEATPIEPVALDFSHFANGDSITSEMVFVNVGTTEIIRPAIYFYDTPIAAESVVDITGDLEVQEDGSLSVLMEMEPPGRTHDFNPRARRAGAGIGEGPRRRSHRRGAAL